jgi:hypothetical protein
MPAPEDVVEYVREMAEEYTTLRIRDSAVREKIKQMEANRGNRVYINALRWAIGVGNEDL